MTRFYPLYAPAFLSLGLYAVTLGSAVADEVADSGAIDQIVVTSRKLDRARDGISADLGASRYVFDSTNMNLMPQGPARGIGQILLQAPGVTQDSDGDYHIRNEHGNIQYRVNGVMLPQGPGGFDDMFDSRFASKVALITGTLPAQYGYHTAGVIDITSKNGIENDGGEVALYGGSHNTISPSFNYGGSSGKFSYYVSGTYLQNDLGTENPTASRNAIHDHFEQAHGFAYLSRILSPEVRLSAILGSSASRYEIPNVPGQLPVYSYLGRTAFDSTALNDYQRQEGHFAVLSLQYAGDRLNLQVAPFISYSRIRFYPDQVGDLMFNGISDATRMTDLMSGVQADGSYQLSDHHTLRMGVFFSAEHSTTDVASLVFPVDALGAQTSDVPLAFADQAAKTGYLYGIYLQDEWSLTSTLTLNYGARFDRVQSYTHEQQVSPRINLVWKFGEDTAFHIGYARDFTPPPQHLVSTPTLHLYDGTTKASKVLRNDPVRAERETYIDAGFLLDVASGLDLGLDAYYKKKHNLLDEGQFGNALVQSPFNYQEGWSYGLELTTNYHHGPFSTYFNAALAREKGRNIVSSQFLFGQNELDYIAAHKIFVDHDQTWTLSGGFSYRFANRYGFLTPTADFIFGSGMRRNPTDGSLNPNGAKMPSYLQVNFGLAQDLSGPGVLNGMSLSFDVTNLFDHVYQLRDGSGVGLGAPQYGPRRAFYVTVRKGF